tara:strand:- start:48 stop:281 length:234 start_codon:yes stop_codon:yes gene_type:complete
MTIMLAKVKKKSQTKKPVKKVVASKRKKTAKKKTNNTSLKSLALRFKIDKNNWIVLYYAVSYIGIFGLFALAIYYSN